MPNAAAVVEEKPLTDAEAQAAWDSEVKIAAGETPAAQEAPAAAAATVDTTKTAEPAKPAAAKTAAPAANEWEGVPEVVRRNIEAVNENVRKIGADVSSAVGRVGAIQREIQTFKTVAAAAPAGGEKPTAAQINAAATDPAKWEAFKADYPDIAAAMDERLKGLTPPAAAAKPDLTPIETRLQQYEQTATSLAEDNAKLRVEVKHTGWEDTVRTPEFGDWLKRQAPDIRLLADSSKPVDAIRMLDRYKTDQEAATKAAQVTGDRKGRLERNVAIANTSQTPQKSDDDLTAEEIWAKEAAKFEKTGVR